MKPCQRANKRVLREVDATRPASQLRASEQLNLTLDATDGSSGHRESRGTTPLDPERLPSYHELPPRGRVRLSQNLDLLEHRLRSRPELNEHDLILAVVDHRPQQLAQRDQLAPIQLAEEHAVLHVVPEVSTGPKHLRPAPIIGDVVRDEKMTPFGSAAAHRVTIPT